MHATVIGISDVIVVDVHEVARAVETRENNV